MEAIWHSLPQLLGPRVALGVFHSLSAIACLGHMKRHGRRWDGVLLFDPPLAPPPGHPLQQKHELDMAQLARGARARRRAFASPHELAAKFARQPAFRNWPPEACEAMARATLLPHGGGWQLSCAPEREAVMYETNTDATLLAVAQTSSVPLLIAGGDADLPDAPASVMMARAAGQEFGIPYEAVLGTTHFLQIERPEACGALTRDFFAANAARFEAEARLATA
jgi:pimeloyl-ACP methyl ester carboxylesterase